MEGGKKGGMRELRRGARAHRAPAFTHAACLACPSAWRASLPCRHKAFGVPHLVTLFHCAVALLLDGRDRRINSRRRRLRYDHINATVDCARARGHGRTYFLAYHALSHEGGSGACAATRRRMALPFFAAAASFLFHSARHYRARALSASRPSLPPTNALAWPLLLPHLTPASTL